MKENQIGFNSEPEIPRISALLRIAFVVVVATIEQNAKRNSFKMKNLQN